ncbi:hypothetical protein EZJ43_07710 [Pedobacter changchengzhani]|uniref:Uncharacterized protein n=1 Tax=Pedobacter changchengzhani TaxID=2529274 RepID=A0A4R5MM95_9SPHI|nr:hypothetical protein [Pedobacter changchengzhani]TDG36395.1 hypothetical protein EZJ43_07710 [Pedobacter changchengzhani]
MTSSTFKIKHLNFINLITFLIFFGVVIFKTVQKSKANIELVSTVTSVKKSTKYKINYISVQFKNNERIVIRDPYSFFDIEEYLSIKIGNSVRYSLFNDKVSAVTNLKNNNELDELYFVIQETDGFQFLVIVFLLSFNAWQMVKLDDFAGVVNVSETQLKRKIFIQKANDLTKKYVFITLAILSVIVFFIYQFFSYVKQNQLFFDNIYFYKYLIFLSGLLIPLPFMIVNYRLLKKVDS